MSFNTKYILPGDDKNQIISKVNYNFSQIYYAGVGLQGEKGIIGPTGIIGQVGKDGPIGPTGNRANIWIFQDTPPGIYSLPEVPLENYDVWVNTSPTGSTGGLNRIYQYNSSYSGGEYGYFWIDTGENFTSGDVFTIIQGVSGPGQSSERNAISAGATSTFVFTDRNTTESNSNPTYSKVLIENSGFSTAELPIFGFDKTFYSSDGPPSFYWQDTDDYSLEFSTDGGMSIQSQATGYYSSTGATLGITAGNNVTLTSFTDLGLTGPSGINIESPSIGFTSSNFLLGNFASFQNLPGGFSVQSSSSGYSLDTNLSTGSTDNGLVVLNYSGGPSGGLLRNNINLESNGNSLFRITNASSGSYPSLSIGFTGSTGTTGPSGGTGANVYKSYQVVTGNASSKLPFGSSPSSNFIQIIPTNDVIRVVPSVATGASISSNGRTDRIWLYVTNISEYVEAGNSSEIDIFMDSSTYSIGGVALETNFSTYLYIYGQTQINDGGTGPTGGCRHVKINLFGDSFPSTVNNSGNKFAYIQTFVSSNNTISQVPYFYSSFPTFDTFPTVICTELFRQGFMSEEIRLADQKYGEMILSTRPEVMEGYHYWALPIVEIMKRSRKFTSLVWIIAKPWSEQMAYEMGYLKKGNLAGKILTKVGIFFSGLIGKILIQRKLRTRNNKTSII